MNRKLSNSAKLLTLLVISVFCLVGCGDSETISASGGKKVIVLGFDGVDYGLLSKYMAEGRLPNFKRLSGIGDFKPLGTSMPPQSPVAWSNFITGMNPGGHGIYDFLHRDPTLMIPISSTTETEGSTETIQIGKWVIPLSSGHVKNLRKGTAFWNILEENGIPTTVFKVPANYPPVESKGKTLSGMGTPDLLGTWGTFSYYTDSPPANKNEITGGVVYPVRLLNNGFESSIVGPKNTFIEGSPDALVKFDFYRDPTNKTARIEIMEQKILLQEKEWSDWVQIQFDLLPAGLQSITGICRFYLKEAHPNVKLYVSPINIDPSNPVLPLSTPEEYVGELYDCCGHFYTQGMPEDTKALSWEVLDHADFHSQSRNVLEERLRLFDHVYNDFKDGFLFFYFSSTDLNAHMFYNMIDPEHPSHNAELAKEFADVIPSVYENVDRVVGHALDTMDEDVTLLVMSDHGFAPFRRAVNLNTWLYDNGYIKLRRGAKPADVAYFDKVDWRRTKAYGLGFNGLYVNLNGRESGGIVAQKDKDALVAEISEKLLQLKDPKNGEQVILRNYPAAEIYSGVNIKYAPDLVIGYNRGYRASDATITGSLPKEWITDNMAAWCGDHCMDAELVPGIILSNKKIKSKNPKLFDLAPSILEEFGLKKTDEMVGGSIF